MSRVILFGCIATALTASAKQHQRPNILIAIADDQSFPYASAYGTAGLSTPGFDYIADHGMAFSNAYVCSPGSSPSRASILTGRYPWQIAEAGTHASSFPREYICFPDFFAQHGYRSGFTGKGWGPGDWKSSGRDHNPAGQPYNSVKLRPPFKGISDIDYSGNFDKFLSELDSGEPFIFWYGANEPHRPYDEQAWNTAGRSLDNVLVPAFLPAADIVKGDIANYALEIEWFDSHLCKMLDMLRQRHMLDNTIVIVTADNGMPFPHAKANCYDAGVHVPLAICWGDRIKSHSVQDAIVSMVDIFPTIADLARLGSDSLHLSGESMAPLLGLSKKTYCRQAAFFGRERHSSARPNNQGYPIRAIRKGNFLLIHNFHPDLWPAGNPLLYNDANLQRGFRDIDDGPTKTYLIAHHFEKSCAPFYNLAVAKRPEYELYDLGVDAECCKNLSADASYAKTLEEMKAELQKQLQQSCDTRLGNNPEIWESYPRLSGPMNKF